MARREMFQACADCPEGQTVTLKLYDGETPVVAIAHEGAVMVQISKGFYLEMDTEIANRLVLTLANAVCEIDMAETDEDPKGAA